MTLQGSEDTCEILREDNTNIYGTLIFRQGNSTPIKKLNVLSGGYTIKGAGTYDIYMFVSEKTGIKAYTINHVKNVDIFSVTQNGIRACINQLDSAYSSNDIQYWLGVTKYGEIVKVYK